MASTAYALLAALPLTMSALAVADTTSANGHPAASSYAPRARTEGNVYGSPIGPPVVGRARTPHHVPSHKKQPSTTAKNRTPARHKSPAQAQVPRHAANE